MKSSRAAAIVVALSLVLAAGCSVSGLGARTPGTASGSVPSGIAPSEAPAGISEGVSEGAQAAPTGAVSSEAASGASSEAGAPESASGAPSAAGSSGSEPGGADAGSGQGMSSAEAGSEATGSESAPAGSSQGASETATTGVAAQYECQFSVAGVCFDTPPKIRCCSPAATAWSQIVVGERFTLAGHLNPGDFPDFTSLALVYPSGKTAPLPLDADRRFHQEVDFDEPGTYKVVGQPPSQDNANRLFISFRVPYRTNIEDAETFQDMFGVAPPAGGVRFLMVPWGQKAVLKLDLSDAAGKPAADQTVQPWGSGMTPFQTDASGQGQLAVKIAGDKWNFFRTSSWVYGGWMALAYLNLSVEDGQLVGLPGGGSLSGVPGDDGVTLFPIGKFLDVVTPQREGIWRPCPGGVTLPYWNKAERLLELGCPPADQNAEAPPAIQPDVGQLWLNRNAAVAATFRSKEKDGVVYADLAGLAAAVKGIGGYAAVTASGHLLVTGFDVP